MPNHLADESSPYLQQHAHNPVDWYPWGGEAFERARAEDKPVFLSIGYSTCHWCHVMAHESFEDPQTAALLNRHFVSIKVDREERPDLDRIYMGAVQAMTGSGGWPMSIFMSADGHPFYGGTYFPRTARYGMPSFQQLLGAIAEAWEQRRDELLAGGQRVVEAIRRQQSSWDNHPEEAIDPAAPERAFRGLRQAFDAHHGGWGDAPKFPQPMVIEFLLRYHHATDDPRALEMVTVTLEAMARGGIYDQLGGGFHRYATDAQWRVPHFEKMLYDNAQLARVYSHAWQVTGDPLFRSIAEETLDYVAREMSSAEGGFYSAQDADTEGEEGRYFTWSADEIRQALGGPASQFLELHGVSEQGNFENRTILTFNGSREAREAIRGAQEMLLSAREGRTRPHRDEKVLSSWNGLMLAAFAEAGRIFDNPEYTQTAQRNAAFLLRELRDADGRLMHSWRDGSTRQRGFLEDYSYVMEGLLALYQTDFDPQWYLAARDLADEMLRHFSAEVGFYDTADDGEALVLRPREVQDSAVPSGNALATTVLLRMARLSGETRYEEHAQHALAAMSALAGEHPLAFGQWLVALDDALATPVEVAIVGEIEADDTQEMLRSVQHGYRPHQVIAVGQGDVPPLLMHREQIEGKATAYVCQNHVCRAPVVGQADLGQLCAV